VNINSNIFTLLHKMMVIRSAEMCISLARKDGLIRGPVHLGVGQEAIAVGISSNLNSMDKIFGAHRSHAHLLALGADLEKFFSEILGKASGHSKGMGASMHLWDQSVGFYGSVPIVAGTVPLAVGAALACKLQNSKDIAVAYLGDGAVEEGVVQESLNLAKVMNLPILFVVENNYFASHMHISERQPSEFTSRFAIANHIPHEIIDGNNVIEVSKTSGDLIRDMRTSGGPRFLEAFTYRWFGHVDWREDLDVGVSRSQEDLIAWKKKDPIKLLSDMLITQGSLNCEKFSQLKKDIECETVAAWDSAMLAAYPPASSLLDGVYAR
jgi:TPP-dependent pyruvate/acetoin dehydrogenase alpha subunit